MENFGEVARLTAVDDTASLVESIGNLLVKGRLSALTASEQILFDLEYVFESIKDRMEKPDRWAISQ